MKKNVFFSLLMIVAVSCASGCKTESDSDDAVGGLSATVTELDVYGESSVYRNQSVQYTASVQGKNNPSRDVEWSVSGNKSSGTAVSGTGLLTVDISETAETLTLKAVSKQDKSVTASAQITVSTFIYWYYTVSLSDFSAQFDGKPDGTYIVFFPDNTAVSAVELADLKTALFAVPADTKHFCFVCTKCTFENNAIPDYEFSKLVNNVVTGADALWGFAVPDTVTRIGSYAFSCSRLYTVTIPDSVTEIGEFAFLATPLTKVHLPAHLKELSEGCFRGCSLLTDIQFGNEVTIIDNNAVSMCTSLVNITLPESLITIDQRSFSESTSLVSVTVPDSVTTIGETAFIMCSSLAYVKLGANTSLGKYPDNFGGCRSLEQYNVSPENPYYAVQNGILYSKDLKTIVLYPCGRKDTEFVIPSTVTGLGNHAFYSAKNLHTVDFTQSPVTEVPCSCFFECVSLSSVKLSESITMIQGSSFELCTALESLVIPASVTSIKGIPFFGWTSAQKIHFKAAALPADTDVYWNSHCNAVVDYGYTGE
jgi:hypothetical protein